MNKNKNSLQVKNLNAWWGNSLILNDISLQINPAELVCLTGPNGAGKSTLLGIMSGQMLPNLKMQGEVLLEEKNIFKQKRKHVAQKIAYLTQNETSSWDYTGRDIILTGRFPYTKSSGFYSENDYYTAEKIIEELNIESLAEKNIFSMSGGEFQKIKIARCLTQEPDFLILDEPVANLDFAFQDELLELIKHLSRSKNMGVLVSIHDLNTASRFADRLILLPRQRQCITGTPQTVLTPQNLKQTYGSNFGTFVHPYYKCIQIYGMQKK